MKNPSPKKSGDNMGLGQSVRYFVLFYVIIVLLMVTIFCLSTLGDMQKSSQTRLGANADLIGARIDETVNLLQSLTQGSFVLDPAVTGTQKSQELKKYSDQFGYMMICYVDKDIKVWNHKGGGSSLAAREYMQRLYSTGKTQVTDAFPSGSDGTTMNYTVAVPLLNDGKVDGCLFSAIYFDEIEKILLDGSTNQPHSFTLFGKNNRVMNSTDTGNTYDQHYLDMSTRLHYLNTDAKTVETSMLSGQSGSHWGFDKGSLYYVTHMRVPGTNWSLFCKTDFLDAFAKVGYSLILVLGTISVIFFLLIYLEKKFLHKRMAVITMLLKSVQDLEKRIYQTEKPEDVDFKEIIQLTSKGLTDGLTGTVTRTVFFDQVGNHMRAKTANELFVLGFADVDNLKTLNDSYGHDIGDMALKNIGYVLREYEKRCNGFIGRYGGDEFIVLLTGFKTREEVQALLDELIQRLHTDVLTSEGMLNVHCSMGVVICTSADHERVDTLVKQADEALYDVKQNGKGNYKLV